MLPSWIPGTCLYVVPSSEITKHTWARIAARCNARGEMQSLYWPSSAKKIKTMKEEDGTRAGYLKHAYPKLENQLENLINEVISLMSIYNSSVKLTRNGEPNNVYLELARDGHWQRKWITISSSSTDLHPWQKSLNVSIICSAFLPITQWLIRMATVVKMMPRPTPSNWLVRLLSTKGQLSLAVKQDSSLIQDRLASRKNFRATANLTEAWVTPNSFEEVSESSAPALDFWRCFLGKTFLKIYFWNLFY